MHSAMWRLLLLELMTVLLLLLLLQLVLLFQSVKHQHQQRFASISSFCIYLHHSASFCIILYHTLTCCHVGERGYYIA